MKTHVHDYFLTSFSNILTVNILISHPMVLFKPIYKARIINKCLMSWNWYETCIFIKRRDLVVVKKIPFFFRISTSKRISLSKSQKWRNHLFFLSQIHLTHVFVIRQNKLSISKWEEREREKDQSNVIPVVLFWFTKFFVLFRCYFFPMKEKLPLYIYNMIFL